MFSKNEILGFTRDQLALDYNCKPSDFENTGNTITENKLIDGRRIYQSDGCFFKAVCFYGRAVFCASPEIIPWCREKMVKRDAAWLFQYKSLQVIDQKLHEFGHEIADIHHYYLPKPDMPATKPIAEIRWYNHEDLLQFKNDSRFDEALAFNEMHPDVLAVAAIENGRIMGMAGASSDSENLWQIGINVIPEYRGRGLATNLVSLLKDEILKRDKIPFYGTVESHIVSQNIALNSGFYPAWAELYSKGIQR